MTSALRDRVLAFRRMHEGPDILVLPGVWDVASARVFAAEGFAALGTTSSGIAWSMGYAVGQDAPWPVFSDASRRIIQSVRVPVSVDVEAGFDDSPPLVCGHVRELIKAGTCGINLEDGVRDGCLREPDGTAGSIKAIRGLCEELDYPLYVNARTDVYLGGIADEAKRLAETILRGKQYAEAGADGFFVPGIADPDEIRSVVREVPLPLNVYALPGVPGAAELSELGVQRVSVGCGPLQALLARTRSMARALRSEEGWSSFTRDWLPYEEALRICAAEAAA